MVTPPPKIIFAPHLTDVFAPHLTDVFAPNPPKTPPAPITELPWFGGSEAQGGCPGALPALF